MLPSSPCFETNGITLALPLTSPLADKWLASGGAAVQPRSFEQRMTSLEQQMLEGRDLPNRIATLESQVLQLQKEVRDEFLAIRAEVKAADDETRVFMRILHEDVLARIKTTGESDESR